MSTFDVMDSFVITGRGRCYTGEVEGLVNAGDFLVREGVRMEITGVETRPVFKKEPETKRRTIGLLVRGDGDLSCFPGTTWEIVKREDSSA